MTCTFLQMVQKLMSGGEWMLDTTPEALLLFLTE